MTSSKTISTRRTARICRILPLPRVQPELSWTPSSKQLYGVLPGQRTRAVRRNGSALTTRRARAPARNPSASHGPRWPWNAVARSSNRRVSRPAGEFGGVISEHSLFLDDVKQKPVRVETALGPQSVFLTTGKDPRSRTGGQACRRLARNESPQRS